MNIFTKIKQVNNFTEGEKIFAEYIVNHPHNVIKLDLQHLAKSSYVSASTIYRVIEKLGLSGLNQLKVQISLQLENRKPENHAVDYNYPFHKHNTHHQIMSKMLSLYDQTLKSTFNLIDLDIFLKIIQALYNAQNIIIFPSIGNYFMAESFQQNMLEIGVKVDVVKEHFYQHWRTQSCQKNDIVMIISYAGRTPYLLDIVKTLKEKGIPMILISLRFKSLLQNMLIIIFIFHLMKILKKKLHLFLHVFPYNIYWIVYMHVILIEITRKILIIK
ncbi:MAG: MurR/RpiR family transcriptional regulator [Thomasclavelia sp.]